MALAFSVILSGYRSAEPAWDGGHHAFVLSEYPYNALNYLRYGLLETKLAPVMNVGAVDPLAPKVYRFSHGPVTALLISLTYYLFGVSDLSSRIIPLLLAAGSVVVTSLLALHLSRSRSIALLALFFCGPGMRA